MGDGIMVEITCEPLGNCNNDQPAFKAFLSRWLAVSAQLVPERYEKIFSYLRKSAAGAAGQCSGPKTGQCGREWNSTTYDGTAGVGEQMSALAIIQSMLLDTANLAAPVGATTGGTSKSDPSAGTGGGGTTGGNSGQPAIYTDVISSGDKAGAGVLTTVVLLLTLIGGGWCILE